MKILVSGCLLGLNCRYCGDGCLKEEILSLQEKHQLIPVCPEQLGGLSTPRLPVEIVNGKAINEEGKDVTYAFAKGAEEVVALAKLLEVDAAILKAKSPSCGYGMIYDGSFSRRLIVGNGFTAMKLSELGIPIGNENNFHKELDI